MRVLIVANYRHGYYGAFIKEQVDALKELGVEIDYFPVVASGIRGYLNLRNPLIKKIREFSPDIIHAHYGLSCLLANLQRKVPVISTYHGSDINVAYIRILSKIAMNLSAHNVFVSQKTINLAKPKSKYSLIPCGVNIANFTHIERGEARKLLGLYNSKKIILFAGAFENSVKNYTLAKAAVNLLGDIELVELKGYNREQVNVLMHAVDVCLMTSFTEGSPQFIKEAMACNCPIVSTDVGDVSWLIDETDGCYITSYDAEECAKKIKMAIEYSESHIITHGRKRIIELGLDSKVIAKKILAIYNAVLLNNQ